MAQINVTGVLTQEMMTYYERVFLERAKVQLVNEKGAVQRTHPGNMGRVINFTRQEPMDIITTPLAEASNPSASAITASTVAVTLSEYGHHTIHSRLLSLTSIDEGMKEVIDSFGQNMGETMNAIAGGVLACGTAFFPNGRNVSTVTTGDVLDASACVYTVQALELARANPYPDGFYLGKTTIQNKPTLLNNSTWINSKTYSDVKDLYLGEMGELYQVRWLLNKDYSSAVGAASEASVVAAFNTYIHGAEAFGCYDLEGDKPRLYILPNLVDSGSPAGRISKISWAGAYVTKILNSDWVLVCKTPTS